MLYLILTIVGGVISSVMYKASAEMGCRRMQHLMVERAILVPGFVCLGVTVGGMSVTGDVIVLSFIAGMSLFGSRWGLLKALSMGHASITFTFWNLSLVIPVLLSIFLWGEVPSKWQMLGLALVPICLLLLRETKRGDNSAKRNTPFRVALYLVLLCACGEGLFSTCFKIMDVRGLDASRNTFLVLYNSVMLMAILSTTYSRGWSPPRKKEYISGTAGGLGLIIAGYFGILAVLQIPGIIFFPVLAAAVLVITVLCTSLFWREKMSAAQRLGIVLSIVAIILVSST